MYQAKRCRVCDGQLDSILHLGDLMVSGFPESDELAAPKAPLDFCTCRDCQLVQLRHTVEPDRLFRDQYWYRSGINETMTAELADIAQKAQDRVGKLGYHDVIVDIGANDGTLLSFYPRHASGVGPTLVGFEPAKNLHALMSARALLIPDYFPEGCAAFPGFKQRCKIITSIACFYDLDDPNAFIEQIVSWLHKDGVWIVQFQDLHQMLQATAFDNIVHEHLFYPSLGAIERMIAPYDLTVVDCETRRINGGSLRLTIEHTRVGIEVNARVDAQREIEMGCERWQTLEKFAWRAGEVRKQLQTVIRELDSIGPIDLYGASTKFNTLAQWCGLDGTVLRQAWERSPEKWGRYTITGIPIVNEETGRRQPPSSLLVGIWQFSDHVIAREIEYLSNGGRIIAPLPTVNIWWTQGAR